MNSRLTILVGISNSGKSTWAHEQWKNDPLNVMIVSRYKIRETLYGYSERTIKDYYLRPDIFSLEKNVTRYEDTLINDALCSGKDVIVDATHLKKAYIERFKYWNVTTEVKTFNVSIVEAVTRDMRRNRQVGDEIIKKQFAQFKSLFNEIKDGWIDFTPVTLEQNPNLPICYIFDIDGTLAHIVNRNVYEWAKVGQDKVDESVKYIIEELFYLRYNDKIYDDSQYPKIIICTGRDGIAEYETKKWLNNNGIGYDEFYIRPKGDTRPDWVVKEEVWRTISEKYYIAGIFEDRLQVVRRARALGLKVFNVEYNNF